ncbi:MAG: hypothetical protein Q9217_002659 [Psora testacea]
MSKLLCLAVLVWPILGIPVEEVNPATNQLAERQYVWNDVAANCPYSRIVGGPKGQAYHHYQVTDNIGCSQVECSAGKLKEHTFGIEAGAGIAGSIVGLSAGIIEEWTSGEQYTCTGGPGDTICVWVKTAYTKYDIGTADGCRNKATIEGKFPNKDNAGGGYYCVVGLEYCRSINSHYWE